MIRVVVSVLVGLVARASLGAAQDLSLRSFPVMRPGAGAVAVEDVGDFGPGAPAFPITAGFAAMDLWWYRDQLATLFPASGDEYPGDSLQVIQRERARAWVRRLRTTGHAVTEGRQAVDFADVALRADDDTLARRCIDTRLRALPSGRAGAVPRSYVLASAVRIFAAPIQDSARLVARMAIAEMYTSQLLAIPTTGLRNVSDSTNIVYRQLEAVEALVHAADAARVPAKLVTYGIQFITLVPQLAPNERVRQIARYPYREVATALVREPNGRGRLDSLNRRLDSMSHAPGLMDDEFGAFALLGHAAPPIAAHAWFNTPDSAYTGAPRTRAFADGRLHVIAFGPQDGVALVAMNRLHRQLADRVDVLYVTHTDGAIGPDIAPPSDETAWLARYYRDKRRIAVPIALWAGSRRPGDFGSALVEDAPWNDSYHAQGLRGLCLLIDGRGIVREALSLSSRSDEARVLDRVRAVLAGGSFTTP